MQWTLAPYGDGTTQVVSPLTAPNLVVGTDGSTYVLKSFKSSGRHNWTIKGTLGVYTLAFFPRCLSVVPLNNVALIGV